MYIVLQFEKSVAAERSIGQKCTRASELESYFFVDAPTSDLSLSIVLSAHVFLLLCALLGPCARSAHASHGLSSGFHPIETKGHNVGPVATY